MAKLIGLHDYRLEYFLPDALPPWFDFECPDCGTSHKYTEDDLGVTLLEVLPPPTFREWW